MKILLFFSAFHSFAYNLKQGFNALGHEVEMCSIDKNIAPWKFKIYNKLTGMPYNLRQKWEPWFMREVNTMFVKMVDEKKPDLILIYNDQYLQPETIKEVKQKTKIAFYLGDSPLYHKLNPNNLATYALADHIFSPDTYWMQQLQWLGFSNVSHLIMGFSESYNYIKDPTSEEKEKFQNDIVFIGTSYVGGKGYKRALFLSKFAGLNFKFYGGNQWPRWFSIFPELKPHFVMHESYYSNDTVNTILNCGKVYPVDSNPETINGIHVRVFDCLGSGILPIVEYRKDLDLVFKNIGLPIVKNYNDLRGIAEYFINNYKERVNLISDIRDYIKQNFSHEDACVTILEKVFNK